MMKKDLVLESTMEYGRRVQTILPNIPNQRYVIGSVYPGGKEGEEFVFCRPYKEDPVAPTHCVISVDEGQYWIEDGTTTARRRKSPFKTFVNSNRVKGGEQLLLKSGDIVSLGGPQTLGTACRPRHIFLVMERVLIRNRDLQYGDLANEPVEDPDSPLANELILGNIMSYLPIWDLENARLVSKKWNAEASKALEKRCEVSFTFDDDYEDRESSSSIRVFRYLHEMRDMKIQTLNIYLHLTDSNRGNMIVNRPPFFSTGEPGKKMLDDLRKLLKSSHNFTTLVLLADLRKVSCFLPFSLFFQELGETLVELRLNIRELVLPEALPAFPLMKNLKKLSLNASGNILCRSDERQSSLLVPALFSKSVEHLTFWSGCSANWWIGPYLQEFPKHPMPKLEGIAIKGNLRQESLPLLLELKYPLTALQICARSEEACFLLERLLWKHSKSLQTLQIQIGDGNSMTMAIKFPSFQKLKDLTLIYNTGPKVSWETDLDYEEHFPSLRQLKIFPDWTWDPEVDPVFNAFFPEGREVRCETVKGLRIRVLPDLEFEHFWLGLPESFQPRMDRMREMFPNAINKDFVRLWYDWDGESSDDE